MAAAIATETGVEVEGYNLALGENEIRKINKDHGSEETEAPRGQRAVTEADYLKIPVVIQSPDSIKLSEKQYNRKPVIEFRQTNGNETTVVAAVVSDKRLDLFVQTTYINKKSGSIATPKSEQADFNTPEASSGTAPNVSISDSVAGVNGKNVSPLTQLAREKVDAEMGIEASAEDVSEEIPSTEGKILRGNEIVEIADVESAGGGKLIVKLTDGSTADAKDLDFPDTGEQELWRVVGQYAEDAESARALLDEYRAGDLDAFKYARGVEEGFLYGTLNISPKEMEMTGTYVNMLNPMQRNMAYKQGIIAGQRKTQQRQEKAQAAKGKGTKKGHLHFDGDRNSLTKRQAVSLQACEIIAKALGIDVYVFESERGADGKRVGENGWYDPKDGSIHIDLHAGENGEGVMVFTLAHELTHFIKDWSPQKFRLLSGFLAEQYAQKGESVNLLVRLQQKKAEANGRSLSFTEAHEEWVADSMEQMLTDGTILEKLSMLQAKDATLVEKIRKFLDKFVQRLKEAYQGMSHQTREGELVGEMVDAAQELQDLFADALLDAGENFRQAEKSTTGEGGVKYQARMSSAEIQRVQSISRISVSQFSPADIKATERFAQQYWKEMGVKSPFFRAWFGDWRANDQTKVQIATRRGDARGIQKNTDTGWNIQVSGKVFNETKVHTESYNKAARPYLPYINDIVRKAVLLDSYGIGQGKMKSPNSLLMHSLYAVVDIGNGMEIIKLYVEEMNNPNAANTSKRAYQLQNIEKYHLAAKSSQNTASSISAATSGTVSTVADLFAAVKQKDADFNPNPVSGITNADGTPMVIYHGSADMFNTFSYGHIGSASGVSILGEGFYFTDKKKLAKNYGENVFECYLQMKKPYHATDGDAYKLNSKKETNRWFNALGRSTPFGGTKFGLIRSIAFELPSVKNNDSTERRTSSRSGAVSDRAMLVDLFEQMVTDSVEYDALQKYKRNMDRMLALEEKIDRLSAEIRRVSFTPGQRDIEYLNNLKEQRKKAVQELNRYDNILLGLEKSGVLRSMIERNRAVITQQSYDKAREYYRRRSEEHETEIRQRFQESRRRAVFSCPN